MFSAGSLAGLQELRAVWPLYITGSKSMIVIGPPA